MKQKEILEYNKLCAEFLGLELSGPGFPSGYFYKQDYYHFEDLKFHSDWNWIHEVLKKITTIQYHWELINFHGTFEEKNCMKCEIFSLRPYESNNGFSYKSSDEKEAVIQAINQFLIWYNENKTN